MYRTAAAISLAAASTIFAQSNPPYATRDAVGKAYPAAPRIVQTDFAPAVTMAGVRLAMPEKVQEIEQWNRSGKEPLRNGVRRPIVDPVSVRIEGSVISKTGTFGRGVIAATAGGVTWGTSVRVTGAHRLRLHLGRVSIPDAAVLWVYGSDGARGFDKSLIGPDGGIWTPSIAGDLARLEIEIPAGSTASFAIDEIAELLDTALQAGSDDTPSCLVNERCVTSSPLPLDNVSRAIAHLEYVESDGTYVCTGGLINDRPSSSGNPAFLLTASHCISSQSEASSLEAFFDYVTACNGIAPALTSVPRTNGSTFLVTRGRVTGSDVTLLKLSNIPANRILLGWTTDRSFIATGQTLYRVSHPAPAGIPQTQRYSVATVNTLTNCGSAIAAPNFVLSTPQTGGTYGGSSGSPVLESRGYIVGQLYGGCAPEGHDPGSGCDPEVYTIDGTFASSYPVVQPFIDAGTSSTQTCTPSSTVVCLNNGRFAVHVDWKSSGIPGQGKGVKYTDASALFWFFSEDNIEMIAKVLNGCGFGSTWWVFSASATDVEYTLYVTDTKTGVTKTYFHAAGSPAPAITDTAAFDRNTSCP